MNEHLFNTEILIMTRRWMTLSIDTFCFDQYFNILTIRYRVSVVLPNVFKQQVGYILLVFVLPSDKVSYRFQSDMNRISSNSAVSSLSCHSELFCLVATLPAVLAVLSGSLGEKVWGNLPGSELVTSIWEEVRGLRDEGGVTEEMGEVVPRGWRDLSLIHI